MSLNDKYGELIWQACRMKWPKLMTKISKRYICNEIYELEGLLSNPFRDYSIIHKVNNVLRFCEESLENREKDGI